MNNSISILDIVHDTTVDGPGFRTAIYAAGCKHQCPGCHNLQSWNIDKGTLISVDDILEKIKDSEFANVTFTGGDPLMQVEVFVELAKRIKSKTSKTIWCYTGYLYEQVIGSAKLSQILPFIDVLVDGRYIAALRDEDLQFRGSSNQRLIDVRQSVKTGKISIWDNKLEKRISQTHVQHSIYQYI